MSDRDLPPFPRDIMSTPYSADHEAFDARDEEPRGRGFSVVLIALIIMGGIGVLIWNAYRGEGPIGQGLPTIFAPKDPKVIPEDRGGTPTQDADLPYYNGIDETSQDGALTPVAPVEQPNFAAPPAEVIEPIPATGVVPRSPAPKSAPASVAPMLPPKTTTAPTPVVVAPPAPPPVAAKPVAAAKPVPAAVAPVVKPSPVVVPVTPVATVAGGGFVVQIASLKSPEEADATWLRLVKRSPALFAGMKKDVKRVDLGDKGIFYRLRVDSFAAKDQARSFCDELKTTGQDCLVAAK